MVGIFSKIAYMRYVWPWASSAADYFPTKESNHHSWLFHQYCSCNSNHYHALRLRCQGGQVVEYSCHWGMSTLLMISRELYKGERSLWIWWKYNMARCLKASWGGWQRPLRFWWHGLWSHDAASQGKMGKVACKASTDIGTCAWKLLGRQPANRSG